MQADVVGGFVTSYTFDYVPGEEIAQGKMWVEFGQEQEEHNVTVVIIGGRDEDRATGARH